jgi:hypothetical protein
MEATHCEEHENVALGLCCMNLEDGGDGCMQVISLWLWCVVNIDRVSTPRNYVKS